MYCVYCDKDFPDDSTLTDEHIVPYAIGGSLALSTRVCGACNSTLGNKVDSPLLDDAFVKMERLRLNLGGHRNNEPQLTFDGTLRAFGQEFTGEYSVTPTTKRLHVDKPVARDSTNIQIVGGQNQAEKILGGFAKAKNVSITSVTREEQVPEMTASWQFSLSAIQRAMVKMALGLAHRQLGETYSRSADAKLLREFIWEDDWELRAHMPLPGNVRLQPDEKGEFFAKPDTHVTALFSTGQTLTFLGVIFGQYQGVVQVCANPVGSVSDGWVYVTDPATRRVASYSFGDYIASVVKAKTPGHGNHDSSTPASVEDQGDSPNTPDS